MVLAVVGAGCGRTGTHSLKVALERLVGGRCHHMIEVFTSPEQQAGWTRAIDGEPVDWSELLNDFRAAVDWPGAAFWRELHAANPEALILLSVRPPEDWYRSASNTIFEGMREERHAGSTWMTALVRLLRQRFSDRFEDPQAMMDAYVAHNDAVRAEAPSAQLLEWSPGDDWAPICDRLGLAVPEEPFPVTNTTADFRTLTGLPPLDG